MNIYSLNGVKLNTMEEELILKFEEISKKYTLISKNRHLFEFKLVKDNRYSVISICPYIINKIIWIYVNDIFEKIPNQTEKDYLITHELGHVEQQFEKDPITIEEHKYNLHNEFSIFNLLTVILFCISSYIFTLLTLSILSESLKFHLRKRKSEYDADIKAVNILKTKEGANLFLNREIYPSYMYYLYSGDFLNHPFSSYRLREIEKISV